DGVCCDTACNTGPCHACSVAAGASADGTCTPLTGPACDDGDPCTQADTCQAGVCTGSNAVHCPSPSECQVGLCNPADGQCQAVPQPDGTPCANGTGVCLSGGCSAGASSSSASSGTGTGSSTGGSGGAGGGAPSVVVGCNGCGVGGGPAEGA